MKGDQAVDLGYFMDTARKWQQDDWSPDTRGQFREGIAPGADNGAKNRGEGKNVVGGEHGSPLVATSGLG